jgi:hypothetical protein
LRLGLALIFVEDGRLALIFKRWRLVFINTLDKRWRLMLTTVEDGRLALIFKRRRSG